MGAFPHEPGLGLATGHQGQGLSPAAVVEFAIGQVLRHDAALDALPAILAKLATAFSGRAALAFQPRPGQPPVILAAHPAHPAHPGHAGDRAMLTQISALRPPDGGAGGGGIVQVPLEPADSGLTVLVAYSPPVGGECVCALALAGDASQWDDDTRSALNAVATAVAAQIRHPNDAAVLAERDALARALIVGSPDAILAMDSAARIVAFNPAAEALSGYRCEDALGQEMATLLIPERDRAAFLAHIETYLATGDAGEFAGRVRVPILRADGTERMVELTSARLTLNGETLFCGFYRDLTQLEQALAAEQAANRSLADQTERLNCLIAAAIPGVLITDEQCLVTHANGSFGKLFGIEAPDRLVGTPVGDTVQQIRKTFADPEEFVRRTSEALAARKPIEGQQIACADGRTFECDYWPVMVEGRYSGDIWLAWDMSDRKALEEQREGLLEAELAARHSAELAQRQLQEQNEKLQELGEVQAQFVAMVSHELRTPLTSIVSFIELIRAEAGDLSKDGTHFLDIIQRNAHRLLRLVGDLLLLSRVESGSMPLELAPVSIPEVTAEAVRDASAPAAGFGITLDVSIGDGPAVQADQLRLLQVLDNLIANAVKFSHPGDRVRVGAAWDGQLWRIDVTDSGIGIPAGELGQLFDRFVRASNARTSGRPGTGLGLSVVKAIVELHGGRIGVDSMLGRGTTFSVYLPVAS